MKDSNDSELRPSPAIYRNWCRAGIEWGQAVAGLVLFAVALLSWRELRWRIPPGPTAAAWWAGQVGVAAGLLAVLIGVDRLVRRRWGWYELRLGIVLGACAAAGFLAVRYAARIVAPGGFGI